jgi:ABC-type lipoprotein export system ATPase subunit
MERTNGAMPAIECVDVFKIYKRAELEVVALRGLDLSVAEGEYIAVVGSSGSGKTTLLNLLAGLDRPSAGQLSVGGRDLLNMPEKDLVAYRREAVGFVWQNVGRNLLPYLTARENVELPQAIAGVSPSRRAERSMELLDALGVAPQARRRPFQLSGGEQQRVGIAVALANAPPLLLADEPTGELDTRTGEAVLTALGTVSRTLGVTVVLVTHYVGAARFVDRVVRITDGRISGELIQRPTFRPGDQGAVEEFTVVDPVGRLQIPRELLDEMGLKGRVTVEVVDGKVVIRPPSGE